MRPSRYAPRHALSPSNCPGLVSTTPASERKGQGPDAPCRPGDLGVAARNAIFRGHRLALRADKHLGAGEVQVRQEIGLAKPQLRDLLQFEQKPIFAKTSEKSSRASSTPTVWPTRSIFARHFKAVDEPFVAFTYSNEWVEHYVRSGYAYIDPVVTTSARSLLPTDWSHFERTDRKVVKLSAKRATPGSASTA